MLNPTLNTFFPVDHCDVYIRHTRKNENLCNNTLKKKTECLKTILFKKAYFTILNMFSVCMELLQNTRALTVS